MSANRGPVTVRLRRTALITVPFAVGASATAIAFLLLRDSLPAPMATHFTLDGRADGFTRRRT